MPKFRMGITLISFPKIETRMYQFQTFQEIRPLQMSELHLTAESYPNLEKIRRWYHHLRAVVIEPQRLRRWAVKLLCFSVS